MQRSRVPTGTSPTVQRTAGLGDTLGRAVTIIAYGLLLAVSVAGLLGGGGYLVYARVTNADLSFLVAAAALALAMAVISLQQLNLAGLPFLRLRALEDDGAEISVPRAGISMSASGLACTGFAIWAWIFFRDFGLAFPTILFGCAALFLGLMAVLAWRRFHSAFRLTAEGIEYALGWRGLLRYDDIAFAELRVRTVPHLVLHLERSRAGPPPGFIEILAAISRTISGIAPTNGIAVSVFDLAVQPSSLVDAINRRLAAPADGDGR